MADTSIEWSEKVWNPVRGCDIYSEECKNCYAMRQARRHDYEARTTKSGTRTGPGAYNGLTMLTKAGPVWVGKVVTVDYKVDEPLSWKEPQLVFVNSMSDLFYGDEEDERRAAQRRMVFEPVPAAFVRRCFDVMARCPQHTFQILTKRPRRMLAVLSELNYPVLPNVLLGCSAGSQKWADVRRASMYGLHLRGWRTWVSYEPAIGPVNWQGWDFIYWLVAGGESGYGRRFASYSWFELGRDFCRKHGIAFFMKQIVTAEGVKLDFNMFPVDLRVREYPRIG